MTEEKSLYIKYMKLPFVDAMKIASKLRLTEPFDEKVSDLQKRKFVFKRAKVNGLLASLKAQIAELTQPPKEVEQ